MPRPNEYANNWGSVGAFPPLSRDELARAAQGLISQNVDRNAATAGQILTDGTAYFMLLGLRAGDIASSVSVAVSTIGVTPTVSKVGLYSRTGVQLAASAELGTIWSTATGVKTSNFITPYTVPVDDAYYVCVIGKAGTLPILRVGNVSAALIAGGPGVPPAGTIAAQTDLPASPATITTANASSYWVAVS